MASYFCIFPVPDSHIDFIHAHPRSYPAYIDGELPDLSEPAATPTLWQRLTGRLPDTPAAARTPDGWPTSECTLICGNANHRNVDLYHRILNGTDEFVTGSGSLFQTWLESGDTRRHSAIDLTHANEDFAFKSDQVPELVDLLASVDLARVRAAFTEWLRQRGETYDLSDDECVEILDDFKRFAAIAREAVLQSNGLVIIGC